MTFREEIIGDCRLLLGDCREILPTLPKHDACVTDPPYGIGAGQMSLGKWRTSRMEKSDWDAIAPDLTALLALNIPSVIWGGNYFSLPPARCFLVWNKGAGFKGRDFAECELAWTNIDANAREITYDPLAGGDYRDKQHPTQKPLTVMSWCLRQVGLVASILDPYCGSGTTGVACAKRGLGFTGIEAHEPYFDIACRRIEAAYRQPDLFIQSEPKQTAPEPSLFEGEAA